MQKWVLELKYSDIYASFKNLGTTELPFILPIMSKNV